MTHAEYCDELYRIGIKPNAIINTQQCTLNSIGIRFDCNFFTNHDILIRNGFRAIGGGGGGMIFRK